MTYLDSSDENRPTQLEPLLNKLSRQLSRPAWLALATLTFFLMAVLSIGLTRLVDSAAVLWLPNAFAIAATGMSTRRGFAGILAAHMMGVIGANLAYGDPIWLALGFGIVNFIEVAIVSIVYSRLFYPRWTHDSEETFLRFTVLIFGFSAPLSGVFGGTLIHLAFGTPFGDAMLDWYAGSAISLAAFLPAALILMHGQAGRYVSDPRKLLIALAGVVLIALIIGLSVVIHYEIRAFFLAVIVFSTFALWQGRVGTVFATSLLAVILTGSAFAEQNLILSSDAMGFGNEIWATVTVFSCIAIPANLIAAMVERLEQSARIQADLNVMKTEFLSTMSHEIKTPMNSIHGMFELFKRSDLTPRQQTWADAGLSASRTLQAQVDQILNMARLEERQLKLSTSEVDLRIQLASWIASAEAQVTVSKKRLRVAAVEDLPQNATVTTEVTSLNQIVLNLIENAVKFSEAGTIRIGVGIEANTFSVSVQDEGIGIDPKDRADIFERFWQVDQSGTRKVGGAGLGLAISRALATRLGGTLTVFGALGKGSLFEVRLPRKTSGRGA